MSLETKTVIRAIEELREKSVKRKFTQSVELILNLKDIDMKSPEGRIQERVELPYLPKEKPNKICVIATGELALKAKKAKADLVLGRDELKGLAGNKKDLRKIASNYSFFIAEAPLMPSVGKTLGPALGPRGKMPVPVPPTADIAALMKKYRKMIFVRMRKQPLIRCRVGTESMEEKEIAENIQTVLRNIERKLKRGSKNIKNVYIKMSMGPPVKIS